MNKRRIRKAVTRIKQLPLNKYLFSYLKNKGLHCYYSSIGSTYVAWPSNLMLELSGGCNLACTTCAREYDFGREMDKGFMAESLAHKIIDHAWPYLDSVGLTGMGETLLYNNLEGIVQYIKKKNKGIVVSISTNAHVPDFAYRISTLVNHIDTIQISADGIGHIYESIRRKSSYSTFQQNVKTASEICTGTKTDLMLNMVVTVENYLQMSEMVDFAAQNNILYLDFTMFNLASVTGFESSYYQFYNTPEFRNAYEFALQKASKLSVTVNSGSFNQSIKEFRNCPYPWGHFSITWQGFLVPCCAKPFPKIMNFGNVKDSDLITLLNGHDYRKFRELWYKNVSPAFCKNCHFITGSTT